MKTKIIFFILFSISTFLNSQNIEIDKTFGDAGVVKLKTSKEDAFKVAVYTTSLKDGSYLTYNYIEDEVNGPISHQIVKFQPSGKLDTTFGYNGYYGNITDIVRFPPGFTILPNESIATTNYVDFIGFYQDILDKNGNRNKRIIYNFGDYKYSPTRIISNSNSIFILGVFHPTSSNSAIIDTSFIIKTDFEGKLDSSFADNGIYIFGEENINVIFANAEIQGEDLIIFTLKHSSDYQEISSYLFRLSQNGDIDNSFGDSGKINITNGYEGDGIAPISVDSIGNIYFTVNASVYKFNKNGKPNLDYGINGVAQLNNSSNILFGYPLLFKDGSIILFGGSNGYFEESNSLMLRYNKYGQPDSTFGYNGIFQDYFGGNSIFFNGTIDKNGKILAIGGQGDNNIPNNLLLVRYKQIKTGIEDYNLTNIVTNIYPNPIINNEFAFTYQLDKSIYFEIDLYNTNGEKIVNLFRGNSNKGINKNNFTLPSELSQGTYLIKLKSSEGIGYSKLIILH